ncbi:M14 family metallopeptidase [Fusibacter sp. 3D3]|uniref:M14 family metallopeptidase n=1 Tax=Fusibacter sp. 3D3 TaxID=1048380 RepID=UPI000853BB49|nr:M14 family metallopeptidase [Fusibacter sp. 3D3]GAU76547.1 succinate dehydrogenase subunit [Fusibacter sp. 3D3]
MNTEKIIKTYPLNVINSQLSLDVFEFGDGDGETCLITAGVHGAEDTSILAAFEVMTHLESIQVKGTVIVVPICNPNGFYNFSKQVVPEDGLNLNRVFPGNPEGTLSQKIAYTLERKLVKKCDYHVDLHGGDVHEKVMPFVYYVGEASDEVVRKAQKMAQSLNVSVMVKSSSKTGFYSYSGILGKPSILIERGGAFEKSEEVVDLYKKDVLSVLAELDLIASEFKGHREEKISDVTCSKYPVALYSGFWKPQKKPGDLIRKGEILGKIHDIKDNVLQEIIAEEDGIVLYQVETLGVGKGTEVVAYGFL